MHDRCCINFFGVSPKQEFFDKNHARFRFVSFQEALSWIDKIGFDSCIKIMGQNDGQLGQCLHFEG